MPVVSSNSTQINSVIINYRRLIGLAYFHESLGSLGVVTKSIMQACDIVVSLVDLLQHVSIFNPE